MFEGPLAACSRRMRPKALTRSHSSTSRMGSSAGSPSRRGTSRATRGEMLLPLTAALFEHAGSVFEAFVFEKLADEVFARIFERLVDFFFGAR